MTVAAARGADPELVADLLPDFEGVLLKALRSDEDGEPEG